MYSITQQANHKHKRNYCRPKEDEDSHAVLWNNLEVFKAAENFDIAPLKQLARTRLINWIDKNTNRLPFVVREIWADLPPFETELCDLP